MTEEEKIAAVEAVLDGTLIAEARAAFADRLEDEFFAFLTSSGYSGYITRASIHYADELNRVLGKTRCDAIYAEEWNKFEARHLAQDPEIWKLYAHGTEEELRDFPAGTNSEAIDEWIADRQHMTRREEYAGKFYGRKAA